MKPYFIAGPYDGCFYVRGIIPLNAGGWDGDKLNLWHKGKNDNERLKGVMNSDVIIFQRPDQQEKVDVVDLLKQKGKKIVFDNDDTYKHVEDIVYNKIWEDKVRLLDEFIRKADLVTTTTEFLAKEYRELNPNVVVLPNCVDPDDWPEPKRNEGDKVRIGFVGSVLSNNDYLHIKEVIRNLTENPKVTVVVFGLPPDTKNTEQVRKLYADDISFWLSDKVEWQPVVQMHEYAETLNNLRLDMMMIPRKDNYFNRCKSNIKFLEASMLEIPVIAQSFKDGPYEEIQNYVTGVKVLYDEHWQSHLNRLIEDKELRREIGRNAKEYVLKNYDIKHHIHKWKDAYDNVYNK